MPRSSMRRLRELIAERDDLRARVKSISKEVGTLRRDGKIDEAEALQAESRALGDREKLLDGEHDEVADGAARRAARHPQPPVSTVRPTARATPTTRWSSGRSCPTRSPITSACRTGRPPTRSGILDNERATKIARAMFTMQRGAGATLARALCQLALDLNADVHEEIRAPSLVTTATLTATGQLPKFADDAFAIERDDLWCIPTAEVPLTSIYAGEILDAIDLPIRFMAYSPSYRREAGSAGRDTRGMLRAHEFDKVEILALRHARAGARPARRHGRPRRARDRRARAAVPDHRDLHGRHGPEPPPQLRRRGVRTGCRRVARGVVDQLVRRLSGPTRRHPVSTARRRRQAAEGHRVRAHAQRLGARGAAGVGGDRRELPQRGRIGHRARGPSPLHAGHRADRRIEPWTIRIRFAIGGCSTRRPVSTWPTSRRSDASSGTSGTTTRSTPASPNRTR